MFNKKLLNIIGYVLLFLGISMLFSALWSYYYSEAQAFNAIIKSFIITSSIGLLLVLFTQFKLKRYFPFFTFTGRQKFELSHSDGYVLVTSSWVLMGVFSALPFYFYGGAFENYIDCFFESISGLTTTGATIMESLEINTYAETAKGLMFWRSFTQFIGGIGIIVFSIAILPLLGFGGVQLFRAEVAGPVADKLTPRVKQTAKLLWGIYIGLIFTETIVLMIEGVTFYDSLTHSFTSIATSGFSTYGESIRGLSSTVNIPSIVEYTIIFFMIIAATSFSLHFFAFRKGRFEYLKDQEFKVYMLIMILSLVIFFTDNYIGNLFNGENWEEGFRNSLFTSVSLLTTTGFSTVDYDTWGHTSKIMIFVLFFIGGCAGSTTGAIKIIRTILVFKFLARELKKLIHPKGVFHIKIANKRVPEEVVNNTIGFYMFYIFIFVFASIVFVIIGENKLDFITSLSASASAIGNIGPGLGDIGPSQNWDIVGTSGKILATFLMVLGRLEIFTVMLLFSGGFSKR